MKNKKQKLDQQISTKLGTIVLIIIALTVGFFVWKIGKDQEVMKPSQNTATQRKPVDKNQEESANGKNEKVLIRKDNATYEVNIATKELTPHINVADEIAGFSGLPRETENNKRSISRTKTLLSQDGGKIIVVFTTFDKTKEPSGFDGSFPVINAEEFTCDLTMKNCSKTKYLASAYTATGKTGNWFRYPLVWWYKWDSMNNILFGHLTGEGVGNASPVYIYNLNTGKLQQTIGYDSLDKKEKRAEVPSGTFSPSLDKFVMIDNGDLLLYEINDVSLPIKKLDISTISNRISAVAWTENEKMLAIETNRDIYTIDLDGGKITLRYTDTSRNPSGLWLDFNAVTLSPSGRFLSFIDYEASNFGDKLNTVLKTIDLNTNEVIELLHAENISLIYK